MPTGRPGGVDGVHPQGLPAPHRTTFVASASSTSPPPSRLECDAVRGIVDAVALAALPRWACAVGDEMGFGMQLSAERFYSYGCSFVHGYKWMTDYVKDDEQSLTLIADGFAAAVIMTESAICLFEAQCTTTAGAANRRKNHPEWLIPTIDAWILRYQLSVIRCAMRWPHVEADAG